MDAADETSVVLADLVACLAAIGRSVQDAFDPQKFLADFSSKLQRLMPHDRLVVACLDDDRRTFTVFAEHVENGPVLHATHYTTGFSPQGRYRVGTGALAAMFAGDGVRLDELRDDYRFAVEGSPEHAVRSAGFRSALLLPLHSGGRVIGALAATSLSPGAYGADHVARGLQVADLIAPFIQNVVQLQREQRRLRRLQSLDALGPALATSLDVKDVFDRLADAVRPAIDFDVMGICLFSSSGRELERLAEVDSAPPATPAPWRMDLDSFSFADKIRAGETILVSDAVAELDPRLPGDRLMLDTGGRAALGVPLLRGGVVGGALYFGKRRPYWFDASDVEIARYVAAGVVVALQHQRLADEQRRLALAEQRARRLEERLESLRESIGERYSFDRIVGRSRALREALSLAAKVAPTETTVLITGESGTGKEVVARAIHAASGRADGPFLAVNCAALPETLLESELFGHERGAFTGAIQDQRGLFEAAAGGTVLLDEIGEMPPAMQAKLLRVLQEGEVVPLGDTRPRRIDVRVISATNRDLRHEVEQRRFREDLYYRIAAFPIRLPLLRERRDDIPLLADRFLAAAAERNRKRIDGFEPAAMERLVAYSWPGNVRELQNEVERGVALARDGDRFGVAHLSSKLIAPLRSANAAPPANGAAPPPAVVELRPARAA